MNRTSLALVAACVVSATVSAQTSNGTPSVTASLGSTVAQTAPGARASDVKSLDAIMSALYDVISGPAGQKRDWDRMRALFATGARLMPSVYAPDSVPFLRVWDVEQYIATAGPRLEGAGFFEKEVARRTEAFGGVVHAFSTYESRRAANDPKPFVRGINSIQLFNDGTRWWIVSILWESEKPKTPIPAKYQRTTK